jgi:hypothetical protein
MRRDAPNGIRCSCKCINPDRVQVRKGEDTTTGEPHTKSLVPMIGMWPQDGVDTRYALIKGEGITSLYQSLPQIPTGPKYSFVFLPNRGLGRG